MMTNDRVEVLESGILADHASIRETLARFGLKASAETLAATREKEERLKQQGWQFDNAEASLFLLVLRLLKHYQPWFELKRYRVLSRCGSTDAHERDVPDASEPVEAAVKLLVNGEVRYTVREGNGTVHALELALRTALRPAYPRLDEMIVTDYAMRVLDGEAGSSAGVLVTLQSWDRFHHRSWGSVGVADDIVRAIWLALVDCLEFKRWLDSNHSCQFLGLCDCDGEREDEEIEQERQFGAKTAQQILEQGVTR